MGRISHSPRGVVGKPKTTESSSVRKLGTTERDAGAKWEWSASRSAERLPEHYEGMHSVREWRSFYLTINVRWSLVGMALLFGGDRALQHFGK